MDRPAPSFRRATAWSIAVNAVSQVLSLGFSMLMANFFGAGEATDILYCCIGLVAIAGGIVQVANVNVLIPETMRRRVAAGERDSMAFANRFLALFLAVILVVGLLFLAFSVPLLRAWTRFPPSALAANRPILFWMGLAFPLQLASQLLLDILVSYRFLVLPASLACAGRLVNILFVLFFHARLGVVSVAAGLACGSAAQLACNVWLLFRVVGWRLAWRTEIGSPVWRNLGWAEFGNVVAAAAGYFPVYLFSGIGSGWLTALTYAQRLNGVPTELVTQQVSAAGTDVGDLRLASRWDEENKRFNFLVDNTLQGMNPLAATAWLRPSDKTAGADLQIDRLQLSLLEPFLASLVSDVSGTVSGHLTANGPLDKLSIRSEGTRFDDLTFKLLYTQVDYNLNGPFSVNDAGVSFDDISLTDSYGHTGRITGGVPYDHFKDLRINTRIDLQNVHVLNTTSRDNDTFYGQAFADGTVRLSGPLKKIRLGLNVTPRQNTSIHIPLGKSAKNSKSLLTFINQEKNKVGLFDSLVLAKQMVKEKKSGGDTELSVNLRLNANPDAEIQLEIDKETGDILKARGSGQIGITVDGDEFDIKGDYRVDSGSYHFGMLGFTSRDFTINPGGTIAFVGDVMQSGLDLTANYRTKASISPLIADSTAVSTRRTVDCGIGLSGKLTNPEIKFNIDIPDLDPTTQGRVQSALNTEDKRMKQALALLVSGGFVPDEQSGIVNNTTLLYSNASEMMASQLNNIFRQLDIPIDLGFNYQPTENGRNIFDVAVSTQLFNNRVSINGNIGNRQYLSSAASDIVGDLDIEIKLNRQGQLRLTLFSHSADQYSNYLDMSQRNGAGIVYQEDFNTIGDLWRKIFHIKKEDERQTIPDSNPAGRIRPE